MMMAVPNSITVRLTGCMTLKIGCAVILCQVVGEPRKWAHAAIMTAGSEFIFL